MSLSNKINGFKALWQFDNRWQLILSRLFFRRENINVYRYKGLEVLADRPAGEAGIVTEVIGSPMYRGYIEKMDLRGPVNVLDIGANNGCFPLAIKAEGREIKKLVSIELNPQTFSRLRFNTDRNLDCETVLINGALCGENREIEIALGAGGADDNIYRNNSNGKTWKLPGYTFNEVYSRHFNGEPIDICKIDIEGAEFEMLAMPGHDQIKNCRNILMEIHHHVSDRLRDTVINKMTELGFSEIEGEGKSADNANYVHFFKHA
jgi:FkbM family methyltransferase